MQIFKNKDKTFTIVLEGYELSSIAFYMSADKAAQIVSEEYKTIIDYLNNSGYFVNAFEFNLGMPVHGGHSRVK